MANPHHAEPVAVSGYWPGRDSDDNSSLESLYPAFRFRREKLGHRGMRWIAQRRNGFEPGLHTVIAADLPELCAALSEDQARRVR
jgi:hypothetical protein